MNANSELATKVIQTENAEEKIALVQQALDLAKLSQNLLKGKELTDFIQRNFSQLQK